jgi:CRISPR-associated endonuclease/helicase Cas3
MIFWAKTKPDGSPGTSVYQHMINVGCVAKCIAEITPQLLTRFNLQSTLVGALAALHDLGKISPGFQQKCEAWLEVNNLRRTACNGCWNTATELDHGKVSHAAIQDFLIDRGCNRKIAKYIAAVLGAHHGRIKYLPNDRGIKSPLIRPTIEMQSGIDWDRERQDSAKRIWEVFAAGDCPSECLLGDSPAIWWLAGLTSVADWIGSDDLFFSPEEAYENHVSTIDNARLALESIGFIPPVITPDLTFERIFGFPPNDMQLKALSAIIGPGVYVIEAPMGMGKTEAALGAAYQLLSTGKANGMYFALPTQATSNRIHLRMNEFLQKIVPAKVDSRLIHGNSWLLRDELDFNPSKTGGGEKSMEDARNARDWFASAKRSLIAPFGVGTVDQALLGVVAAKHFFVRHFALAGKVVILDEVHSYDLYTGTLIDKLITTLEGLGCTVIVLSATLTGQRREQIVARIDGHVADAYPLISGRTESKVLPAVSATAPKSKDVRVEFKRRETAMAEALAAARLGGAVLWICNTVDRAQNDFNRLKEQIQDEFPIGLLHSRFPYWRREELEQAWMERFGKGGTTRCGCILVSTQIVEQSVDLDADLLITELAPTDMLLQRLGRLWRHQRSDRPVDEPRVCILEEDKPLEEFRTMEAAAISKVLGGKAKVYAPYVLLRSLEVWKQLEEVAIPGQIRQLIETTYENRCDEPLGWTEIYNEWYGTDSAKKMQALMNSNIWQVALEDIEGTQTRLNEIGTVTMVLCRNITDKDVMFVDKTAAKLSEKEFVFATAKGIHRNLVKVPEYCFYQFGKSSPFEEYIYANHCAGVVSENGEVAVNGLKNEYRLHYSDEIGLLIAKI